MMEYSAKSEAKASVRTHDSWWWVRHDEPHSDSVCTSEKLVRRAQRIYGGRVEVIRQTIVTVTEVYRVVP